jgi:hypothetical protein
MTSAPVAMTGWSVERFLLKKNSFVCERICSASPAGRLPEVKSHLLQKPCLVRDHQIIYLTDVARRLASRTTLESSVSPVTLLFLPGQMVY